MRDSLSKLQGAAECFIFAVLIIQRRLAHTFRWLLREHDGVTVLQVKVAGWSGFDLDRE